MITKNIPQQEQFNFKTKNSKFILHFNIIFTSYFVVFATAASGIIFCFFDYLTPYILLLPFLNTLFLLLHFLFD